MSQTPPGPQPPPALIAEATKRAGHVWIVIDGQDRPRPAWHIWRTRPGLEPPGAAYVLTGPGEQPLPGLADAGRVTVIVAGSQAPGGLVTWTAAVGQVLPGSGEWDEVIGQLVAGRLNAMLAEGETSPAQRWARSGAVFRLAPVPPGVPGEQPGIPGEQNSRTVLSAASFAVHPRGRLVGSLNDMFSWDYPGFAPACSTRSPASRPTDHPMREGLRRFLPHHQDLARSRLA